MFLGEEICYSRTLKTFVLHPITRYYRMSASDVTGDIVGGVTPNDLASTHYTLNLISKDGKYQGNGDANTQSPLGKLYGFEGPFTLSVPPGWDGLINISGVTFQWDPQETPGDGLQLKLFLNGQQVMSIASRIPDHGLEGSGGAIQWTSQNSSESK